MLRVLGNLWIEIILNHAIGRLGDPILASQLWAAGRAYHPAVIKPRIRFFFKDSVVYVHVLLPFLTKIRIHLD
jgi:hypothetical protein